MKAECYLLHIYCDNKDKCAAGIDWGEGEEYTGPNRTYVIRDARRGGWRIGKKDICPLCVVRELK